MSRREVVSNARCSFQSFLTEFDGQHVEWVGVCVVPLPPVDAEHQEAGLFFIPLINLFAEIRQPGWVGHRPFVMKTGESLPARSPDVLFVRNENRKRLGRNCLLGPADIAVEICGDDDRRLCHEEKFQEYEQGGVKEYWLVDPAQREMTLFNLRDDGRFERGCHRGEALHSRVLPGLYVRPDWLWGAAETSVISVLKELGIV